MSMCVIIIMATHAVLFAQSCQCLNNDSIFIQEFCVKMNIYVFVLLDLLEVRY